MLFCTSLVALVGAGEQPSFSPRRLQIVNTKRQSTICELTFATAILAVKLNRKRLVVVLEEHIYIYDIGNMKMIHSIDTSPNPNALCSLSPSSENCFLAYPSNSSVASGEVLVFDAASMQAVNIVQAHKSPLSCIAFSYDGTMMATASDKGTVIRVFAVPSGTKLFQFRRGTYAAKIYSISFQLDNTLLSVSGDTDTIHVFKLDDSNKTSEASSPDLASPNTDSLARRTSLVQTLTRNPLMSAAGAVGSFLIPDVISDIWEPTRDFAYCKIPATSKAMQNLCCLSKRGDTINATSSPTVGRNAVSQLYVVTADGNVYVYNVDETTGGECLLVSQYSILDSAE